MAGLIPRQFIDELMLRSDIVEVIDARVPLKKAGKDYKACCPFHQEKSPSFTVSADKQFYHCFGCGAHGTVIGFLMEYERMSFPEAVEDLARKAGMEVPREARAAAETDQSADLLELMRDATKFYRTQLKDHPPAIDYLKRRGITGEVARDFELGYAPESWDSLTRALGKDATALEAMVRAGLAVKKEGGGYYDRFRGRVMFPIHDRRGRIIAFGGRILDKGEPKYLNSPETPLFHKGRELYGLYRGRDAIRRASRVLVVEGYMDVVALAQFGIQYAVATLGTATTREHLEPMFRHAPEIVFCFDGDRAGREAAWRALENVLEVMRDGLQASFLFLPDGEDPDTLVRKEGKDAFEARLPKAKPLADFLFENLQAKVDISRLDGRARLVELARPLISRIQTGVLRQMMLDTLGALAQIDTAKLGEFRAPAPASTTEPVVPRRVFQAIDKADKRASRMRKAVALLLQKPSLVSLIPVDIDLNPLLGAEVLRIVANTLREQPGLNTGAILERFRETEHQVSLEKLAVLADIVSERPATEVDMEAEFSDVVMHLSKEAVQAKIEQISQKTNPTQADMAELRRLTMMLAETGKTRDLPRRH
jgi:DNA primase